MKKYNATNCGEMAECDDGDYVNSEEAERVIAELEAIANNAIHALRKIAQSYNDKEITETAIKSVIELDRRMDKLYE